MYLQVVLALKTIAAFPWWHDQHSGTWWPACIYDCHSILWSHSLALHKLSLLQLPSSAYPPPFTFLLAALHSMVQMKRPLYAAAATSSWLSSHLPGCQAFLGLLHFSSVSLLPVKRALHMLYKEGALLEREGAEPQILCILHFCWPGGSACWAVR